MAMRASDREKKEMERGRGLDKGENGVELEGLVGGLEGKR